LIVVVPAVSPVARPRGLPVLLTVATAVLLDVHVTDAVRSRVVPPVNVPVALNCCVFPTDTEGFAGVIKIEIRTLAAGVWL
jgi:hypothetical protein